MTQLATPKKPLFPYTYKGFYLLKLHGRVLAIPTFLRPREAKDLGKILAHPAVLSAATRELMENRIDGLGEASHEPTSVGACDGYDLVRHRDTLYAVPRTAGWVDLDLEEERRHAGVIAGQSDEELRARVRALDGRVSVEFAGWLPIFEMSGNCGKHPQFTHTAEPPPGYRFTYSAPRKKTRRSLWDRTVGRLLQGIGTVLCLAAVLAASIGARVGRVLWMTVRPFAGVFRGASCSPRARLRVLGAMIRLFFKLLAGGGRLFSVLRFLRSRHFQSQLLQARHRGLVFLTSMPYTYGQNPWVIEIEDPTTLFYPLIQNGQTCRVEIAESPYFPIVRTLLESDQCKGILTHMKSTARMVPQLFQSDKIRAKVRYTPLGVPLPRRWQRHEESEHIDLLFINSWCQVPENFYVRGGLDVLEAFAILHERYPQLRLTMRTSLPTLDAHFHRIMEEGWVRIVHRFTTAEEMARLHADSHIFLLPAARVHIVSLLQAMSYGLAVVTSDGWGFDEYITHEQNGLIVKGRYGKVSWADEQAGVLREDYEPMSTSDPEVVEGLVEAVSRLVEDRLLRKRLGQAARRDVQTIYTLDNWNRGLKEALDQALLTNRFKTGTVPLK
jgi:glycosyltransferase involved in cell wall biosynthesis